MDHIVLTGVKPWDGRYDLDLGEEFTTREWGWVKRLAGYVPLTLDDNAMSDPELACVLACIVLHRAGRIRPSEVPDVFDRLVDAPFGSTITIEVDETEEAEGADAGPPLKNSNGNESFSGDSGRTSSETSAPSPERSGMPGSDSSVSPRVTPLAT